METGEFNPAIHPVFEATDRSALLIVPNEIYYNWWRCVIKNKDFFCQSEPDIFLIPGFALMEHAESFIRTFYDLFFQYELKKWGVDSSFWPVNRTFDMFRKWFDVRLSCRVSDILAQPIFKETDDFANVEEMNR